MWPGWSNSTADHQPFLGAGTHILNCLGTGRQSPSIFFFCIWIVWCFMILALMFGLLSVFCLVIGKPLYSKCLHCDVAGIFPVVLLSLPPTIPNDKEYGKIVFFLFSFYWSKRDKEKGAPPGNLGRAWDHFHGESRVG